MTVFISNRDGNGKTNEEGHYKFQTFFYDGNVATSESLKVTENTTLGLSVLVSEGQFKVDTPTYSYTGWIDADTPVNISTPNIANPRIDVIVLYVDKQAATSPAPPNNPGVAKLMAVAGTANSSPAIPNNSVIQAAVGSGNPFIVLAQVRVESSVTQITNSNITDVRIPVKLSDHLLSSESLMQSVGPLLYPVGSIYTNSSDSTNPATLLGFGTWSRFAQGRVLVSIDGGDSDFGGVGQTGGSKAVTLTEAQMPNHDHGVDAPYTETSTNGEHQHGTPGDPVFTSATGNQRAAVGGSGQQFRWSIGSMFGAGNHRHGIKIPAFLSGKRGNSQAHTNLQPYVTVYMWRRTA